MLWLQQKDSSALLQARGIWGDIFYLLYRRQKAHQKRKKRVGQLAARFLKVTEALPDAALLIDRDGALIWANRVGYRLFNLSVQSHGQRLQGVILDDDFGSFIIGKQRDDTMQLKLPGSDSGSLKIWRIALNRKEILLLARDVSIEEQFQQMQRDFIANVSHELRSPLTVIHGFIEAMNDTSGDDTLESWKGSLELMASQSDRMRQLIEDLLVLSRLERGQLVSKESTIDMVEMISSVIESLKPMAADKQIDILCDIDDKLLLIGYEKELYSALYNLIINAIRYSDSESIIKVSWNRQGRWMIFQVIDHGIGIAASDIPRLTERFFRTDVSRSRASGGTGLGLSITKQALQLHHAFLKIESEEGEGSRFSCYFHHDL